MPMVGSELSGFKSEMLFQHDNEDETSHIN